MFSKELSIIIVNYKSGKYLKDCIASIYAKTPKDLNFEIIIVNNDEESIEFLENEFKELKIINQPKNIGFGAGVNAGAGLAEGKVMMFLNPDSKIISDNINEVLKYFDENKSVAALGSRVVAANGKTQKWIAGKEISFFDLIINNLGKSRSRKIWESNETTPADWVSGTAMFVRHDFFAAVSGFDENFFMYFEDMDLCKRLKAAGGRIRYFPHFEVLHMEGGSYSDKTKQKNDYYSSQELYFKKHRSALEAGLVKILGKLFFIR
jgi:GT2 family glycosyltransferase